MHGQPSKRSTPLTLTVAYDLWEESTQRNWSAISLTSLLPCLLDNYEHIIGKQP